MKPAIGESRLDCRRQPQRVSGRGNARIKTLVCRPRSREQHPTGSARTGYPVHSHVPVLITMPRLAAKPVTRSQNVAPATRTLSQLEAGDPIDLLDRKFGSFSNIHAGRVKDGLHSKIA